ncbi:MAG: hypothetical protein ACRCXQ_11555 [Vagococcus fluvialis]
MESEQIIKKAYKNNEKMYRKIEKNQRKINKKITRKIRRTELIFEIDTLTIKMNIKKCHLQLSKVSKSYQRNNKFKELQGEMMILILNIAIRGLHCLSRFLKQRLEKEKLINE